MLEQFVDKVDKYRAYAFKICHCHELKKDLVNDMFIKLHKILDDDPSKEITDGYIYFMIKHIFLNQKRQQKEYVIDGFVFEQEENNEVLEKRKMINDELSKMPFVERETLLWTAEKSLREIGKKSGVHYLQVFKQKNKYLEKLKKQINGKAIDFKE